MKMARFSSATWARVATLVLGVIILTLGLLSHFTSAWTSYMGTQPYEMCKTMELEGCPPISMEYFYISVITICFTLSSLISLAFLFEANTSIKAFKMMDTGYHFISAFAILAAGIAYIVSTVQIANHTIDKRLALAIKFDIPEDALNIFGKGAYLAESFLPRKINIPTLELNNFNLRTPEKITTGVLTIIQAIMYGVVAMLISR